MMSSPIGSNSKHDDPWLYAPPWARGRPPVVPRRPRLVESPPMAPGLGGPNIDLPEQREVPFEGDVAIRDLRRRLALDPDIMPDPPLRPRRQSMLPLIYRFSFLIFAAALCAYLAAVTPWSTVEFPAVLPKQDRAISPDVLRASMQDPLMPAKLVIEDRQAYSNEPIPLGVTLNGAIGSEAVLLSGLVAGTRLSAGGQVGATSWRVAARDLAGLVAYAPKDFVGVMNMSVDVRTRDNALVDRNIARLAWLSSPATAKQPRADEAAAVQSQLANANRQIDAEELATLVKRGHDFLRTGDISAARLMLRRAAQAGNPQATLSLGATYDPQVLAQLGVLGFTPDVEQARNWYQKAADLGSTEAVRRIERLSQRP
jgi:hypothetical protein